MMAFDWNKINILLLRELWTSGLSSQKIANKMGTIKNAVVGKAHRLKLQDRPSPIVPKGEKKTHRLQPLLVSIRTPRRWPARSSRELWIVCQL